MYRCCFYNLTDVIIEKRCEFNLVTHIDIIDYTKSINKVIRNKLWELRKFKGLPKHLINVIRNLCKHTTIIVENNAEETITTVLINQSVLQGCCLLPLHFHIIYMEDLIKKIEKQMILNGLSNTEKSLSTCCSLRATKKAVHVFSFIDKLYNYEISKNKTKIMVFKARV